MFIIICILIVLIYNSDGNIQKSGSYMVVTQVKTLTCSSNLNISHFPGIMVAYQEWNQIYDEQKDSKYVISHLDPINALTTSFKVELEKFDNNTDIYTTIIVNNASNAYQQVMNYTMHCSGAVRQVIRLVDDGYYDYKIDNTLIYDVSNSVKFSCQNNDVPANLRVVVAWINVAGDRIYPYFESVITLNAFEMHNGSMLCCVYYTVTSDQDGKLVQRFVKNKTLLIYRKETATNRDQSADTIKCTTSKAIPNSNSTIGKDLSITTQATTTTTTTAVVPGKDSGVTTEKSRTKINKKPEITNMTDENSGSTIRTDSNEEETHPKPTNYVIIIISSIAALVLVLLILSFIIKTRRRNQNNRLGRPRPPCPIPTNEPTPHMPFYVNLLFRRECDQEIRAREEPQYEEIMYQ